MTVWASPASHLQLIGPLPEGARVVEMLAEATAALLFAADSASLSELLSAHGSELTRPTLVWIAYPKGNRADINRDTLWPMVAEYGLRPIGQVSVDDVWSAQRFRPLREGEEPFKGGRRS